MIYFGDAMKDNIWKKVLIFLGIIVFSPFILMGLIIFGFFALIDLMKEPSRRKEYYNSVYYSDLCVPYRKGVLYEDGYLFYNEAKKDGFDFQFIHQSSNGIEYLISRDEIFLFQLCSDVFEGIFYHDIDNEWKVNLDGDWESLDVEWQKCKRKLECIPEGTEITMLVKENCLLPRYTGKEDESDDCARELLPTFVSVVTEYADVLK